MNVKVRAIVLRDDRLLVSRERRRGNDYILLPGGRVKQGEAIQDALVREVNEETGLEIVPERLIYVAEVVGMYGVHDVNLFWLSFPRDPEVSIDSRALISLESPEASSMMPPVSAQIAADARAGWPEEARWLGNIRQPAAA